VGDCAGASGQALAGQITNAERCALACILCLPLPLRLQGELDELEREEFFRLKKVQSNKKKHAEAAEALAAAEAARAKAANGGLGGGGGGAGLPRADQNEPANVLQEHDADIIF
jgi:hypothetical protein